MVYLSDVTYNIISYVCGKKKIYSRFVLQITLNN